jgi:heat shock protein HslJ
MIRQQKFAIFMVFITLVLTACAGTNSQQIKLDGTVWILTHIQGNPVLNGTMPTLKLEAGQASGNGSCNSFGGEYTLVGAKLTFGALMSTMMACDPPEIMQQEQAYLAALGSAVKFNIQAGKLNILDKDSNIVLTFSAQETSLEGKAWQMNSFYDGKSAIVSALEGSPVTAQFGDGMVSGSAGCNQYSATYTQKSEKLTIGPVAATEMWCEQPSGVMEQESQYLSALTQTASYRMEGNRLTLLNTEGNIMAEFTRMP